MKKYSILPALALVCALMLCSCGKKENHDVYLLIGQSNMAGRGTMIEGDTEVFDDNVFLLDSLGQPVPATNPLNLYSTIRKKVSMQQIGPGFAFSKKISEATGRRILLVVNARGGSSIEKWVVGGKYYSDAVSRTKQALEHGELKAILWHQGEADSESPEDYLDMLAPIVEALRTDLEAENVPFIAGEIAYWNETADLFNPVIRRISEKIDNADYVSAEGCGQLKDDSDPHFSRDGQLLLGERYAEKVLKMCYPQN